MRELTLVGPGTPMGELLRRYWHPVGLAGDATDTPKALRVLGEDLVLFPDRQGRPGPVTARCPHRGTTLYSARAEERATPPSSHTPPPPLHAPPLPPPRAPH